MKNFPVMQWLCAAVVLWATGCHAGAVEPFYNPSDLVEAPRQLAGKWSQKTEDSNPVTLNIQHADDGGLRVDVVDSDGTAPLAVFVFKAPGGTYADVQMTDTGAAKPISAYVLRPHFLVRVALDAQQLSVWLPEKDWLRRFVRTRDGRKLRYNKVTEGKDGFLLFMSPTRDLRRALAAHHGDAGVWSAPVVFAKAP